MRRSISTLLASAAVAFGAACTSANATDWLDWDFQPFQTSVGDAEFTLGGDANGAVYSNDAFGFPGLNTHGASGAVRFFPRIERTYDSGLVIGFHASILAYHDHLSNDRYNGDAFEKAYGSISTGLGTIELGDVDGAAYRLAVAGPKVDEKTSIDDPEMTFFLNPLSGRAFDEIFTVRTEVGSSLDYAKLSYYSPRLFGVQLGFSFTPSEGKDVLPFVNSGPRVANRQRNIWDMAANYSDSVGPITLGAYGAFSVARDAAKTFGHEGLTEWALGVAGEYPVNDDLKLSLGGAFRESNAYAFNTNDVQAVGSTRAFHLSTTATYDSWIGGGELVEGDADGSLGSPSLGVHGYQASIGYVLNSNAQLTFGWQQLRYARNFGTFYNGQPSIRVNAEYLHLDFHV